MNASAPELDLSSATMLPPLAEDGRGAAPLQEKWQALHEAAEAVAELAQLGSERPGAEILRLPERAAGLDTPRRGAIERGIDDLSMVMQVGLSALLAAATSGKDATAAALTLWREFHHARAAIMAFAHPQLPQA